MTWRPCFLFYVIFSSLHPNQYRTVNMGYQSTSAYSLISFLSFQSPYSSVTFIINMTTLRKHHDLQYCTISPLNKLTTPCKRHLLTCPLNHTIHIYDILIRHIPQNLATSHHHYFHYTINNITIKNPTQSRRVVQTETQNLNDILSTILQALQCLKDHASPCFYQHEWRHCCPLRPAHNPL